jgi:hypothetical protein
VELFANQAGRLAIRLAPVIQPRDEPLQFQ